ncbi:MAG: hypothetical protein Q9217_003572 [Psora testacea]
MAQLSESELDIIKANPIKDEFKTLLATFKSTYSNAKVVDSPAAYEKLLTDPAGKGLALRFIGTLQLLPASSALPSRKQTVVTGRATTCLPIHNRVRRRVIIRDFGKPIYEASSLVALITGLIGAIEGHESLLNTRILHRNISINNIMLRKNKNNGFLIDADLGIRTGSDRASGAPGKTGTKAFIAIGALLGEPHSFIHDLESFFWVLFWICIHYNVLKGKVKRRIVPQYKHWNYLPTERLASEKASQISKGIFDTVDSYFTEHCKPLLPYLKELYQIVFPGGRKWFTEHRALYSDITRILKKAKDNIKAETVS